MGLFRRNTKELEERVTKIEQELCTHSWEYEITRSGREVSSIEQTCSKCKRSVFTTAEHFIDVKYDLLSRKLKKVEDLRKDLEEITHWMLNNPCMTSKGYSYASARSRAIGELLEMLDE